jgi:transposase
MSDVCREFGISRKTGYKLLERYRDDGPLALSDRSRRPSSFFAWGWPSPRASN